MRHHLRVLLQLPPVVHGDRPDHVILGEVVHQRLVTQLRHARFLQLPRCPCLQLVVVFAAEKGQFGPLSPEFGGPYFADVLHDAAEALLSDQAVRQEAPEEEQHEVEHLASQFFVGLVLGSEDWEDDLFEERAELSLIHI